jgi:hypothetical protein
LRAFHTACFKFTHVLLLLLLHVVAAVPAPHLSRFTLRAIMIACSKFIHVLRLLLLLPTLLLLLLLLLGMMAAVPLPPTC